MVYEVESDPAFIGGRRKSTSKQSVAEERSGAESRPNAASSRASVPPTDGSETAIQGAPRPPRNVNRICLWESLIVRQRDLFVNRRMKRLPPL
jgi:hypothetical protein